MDNTLLRIPIVCPDCARELLTSLPAASVAEALASGDSIRLFSQCHDQVWQASSLEREQLREYLEAVNLSRTTREPNSRGLLSRDS
jgi:hypothetical protein